MAKKLNGQNPEKLTKISKKIARVVRNEKGQLQPGSILNPEGKEPGTRSFETDFDEAVEEIAKANNMTRSEARKILLKKAFAEAKEGNFSFYKDIHDRIYGKAIERHELTGKDGKDLFNPTEEEKDRINKLLKR